jgi:hypothetical protein
MTDEHRSHILDALLKEGGICSLVPQVPGLTPEEALFAADQLTQLGWIIADVSRLGSGVPYLVMNLRITEAGRAAAQDLRLNRRAQGSGNQRRMDQSIEAKKVRRALFLAHLYTAVAGSETRIVNHSDIGTELGWPMEETEDVANYLEREGLLKFWAEEGAIGITHAGITEYEQLIESPDKATAHFLANSIAFFGDVHGQVAIGTGSISQAQTVSLSSRLSELRQFVVDYRAALALEPFDDPADERTAEALLTVIEAQIDHPSPNESVLKTSLSVLRDLAIGVGASGAWIGLVELAHHLLH